MFRKRPMPSANVVLQFKWDLIDYETHRFNIRHAKPKIAIGTPRIFPHLQIKPQRLQAELERSADIERENVMLMDRIATVHRKGSWVDHRNYHEIRSRNTFERQKRMFELSYANKTMLERLGDVHTVYNRKKLEDDYQMQKKYASLLTRYPNSWTQILHKITKEREKIKEDYVYPRAGYFKKSKSADGKVKLGKLTALGAPGLMRAIKKWRRKKPTSTVEKAVQEDEKAEYLDIEAERRTAEEHKKVVSKKSEVEKKTVREAEKDASLESDAEKKIAQEDEKGVSLDSGVKNEIVQEDEKDALLDSDGEN